MIPAKSQYLPYDSSVGMLPVAEQPTYMEENLDFKDLDLGMDQESVTLDAYTADPFSRTPSPFRSSRSSTASTTFDLWQRQYDIYNRAWAELFDSLFVLSGHAESLYLSYAMMPIVIMGLASRPGSRERGLCLDCFRQFKDAASSGGTTLDPTFGSPLEFDIPWDRLDAFSAEYERERSDNAVFEPPLNGSAPDWNWRDMLLRMDVKMLCKYMVTRPGPLYFFEPDLELMGSVTGTMFVGTMHKETGTNYWAMNVLASVCNEETLAAFMQPSASQA